MSRVFVVTGANRGIGLEIVRRLSLLPNATVVGTSRTVDDGAAALKELGSPKNVQFAQLDIADKLSVANFVKQFEQKKIDSLVNNAGFMSRDPLSKELAEKTLSINLNGTLALTNECMDLLGKGSRIINVTSGMGELNKNYSDEKRKEINGYQTIQEVENGAKSFIQSVESGNLNGWRDSAYGVSKALLNKAGRILAQNLKEKEIFVANVCPGWVQTRMGGPKASVTVEAGADGIVWLASEEIEKIGETGLFWRHKKQLAYEV